MDAHLTNDYLARAREILGDRTDSEIKYDDTVVAFLTKGMNIKSAVNAANRGSPAGGIKIRPGSPGQIGGTIRLHQQEQIDAPEIGNQGMMSHGAAPLICYHARRLDCPAFLRHSKTGQTNRLEIEPIRQRSQHPFPKSPQLHSRYVRSDFRNGRSLRPSSSNSIRSAERDSDGFLKPESLDFFETPSPTKIVSEKHNQKPGN